MNDGGGKQGYHGLRYSVGIGCLDHPHQQNQHCDTLLPENESNSSGVELIHIHMARKRMDLSRKYCPSGQIYVWINSEISVR